MVPSLANAPTAREVCILAALLIILLVTCRHDSEDSEERYLPTANELQHPTTLSPQVFDTQLSWEKSTKVPETTVVAHVPGWTMFDRLYSLNGTLYVVTDEPETIPARRMMISTAAMIANGPVAEAKRVPTDKEMRIISTATAKELFGLGADRMDGVTVSILEFMLYLRSHLPVVRQ